MQHVSQITPQSLAAAALRAYLFWSARCRVLAQADWVTSAEREVAQRNRDSWHAQYRLLAGENVQ